MAHNNEITALTTIREMILGYVFWSYFQCLGPMIWFYPLNELEISGYEVFVLTFFSPILVAIPGVLSVIQNRWVLAVLRLIQIACLTSFHTSDTLPRLMVMAAGTGATMLVFAANFWSQNTKIKYESYWGLVSGLLLFIVSRIWFVSFVPTWWTRETNIAVITIAAIATLASIFSDHSPVSNKVKQKTKTGCSVQAYWLPTGLGAGSLFYLTHWCFGEVSLITRWTVKGFPDHGPLPNPWGAAVLACLVVGVYLSWTSIGESLLWWCIGAASFAALYYLPTWQGFSGGLLLAIYTMSLWPAMIERLSSCPPSRTLCLMMITYLVQIFYFVWTVAYNFVPGGVYTRERTDALIAFVVIALVLAMKTGKRTGPCVFTDTSEKGVKGTSIIKLLMVVLLCAGLLGFGYRYDPQRYNHPVKKSPKEFTAAIWTYHFGYDNKGWPSLERSAQLLNDTGADLITLLESDASKPFLGNNDLGMWLGERLGMYVDFGPATKDHTWGNLILSKYPIVKSTHHLLPSPYGELAPGVTATINISGSLVDYVVVHMGNDRDNIDRKLQAKFLAKELRDCKNPVVFLGYVTSAPGSRDYGMLINMGKVNDIDETDRERWCEYIMYRGLIRLGYARVTRGDLSDTEVQMARFRIPDNPKSFKDNKHVVIDPSKVPDRLHFNPRFGQFHRGHGYFREHRFHMSTPKYFIP